MVNNERSPLDLALEKEASSLREQSRSTIDIATKSNPDKYATVRGLAASSGLDQEIVERNTEEVQRKQKAQEIQTIIESSPVLSKKFKNPDFARLAHDDVSALFKTEASLKPIKGPDVSFSSVVGGMASALHQGLELTRQGIRMQWAEFIGSERMKKDALRKYEAAQTDVLVTTPGFESSTGRGLYGGLSSLARQAPGMAASLLTRSTVPMLASAGQMTEAEAYGKYISRGATPEQAAIGAMGEGATEVLTELIPMGFMVKKFGKTGAGEFLGGLIAREVPSEQVATIVQDAIDTAIANPDKTWGDYFNERPGAAYETLLATLVQSSVMGAASSVSKFATGTVQADKAIEDQETLQEAVIASSESKLRERDPEFYREFIEDTLGADNNVYIAAEDAEVFFQSNPDLEESLSETAPEVAASIKESLTSKSDVVIPKADYLTYFTEFHDDLSPVLRNDLDGMSAKEAENFVKEGAESFETEAQKALVEQEQALEFEQSAENVAKNIKDQIVKTGRFKEDVAQQYAALHKAFVMEKARRLGVTPEEAFSRVGVQGAPIAGEVLNQESINTFSQDLEKELGLKTLLMSESKGDLKISSIIVPKDQRKQGVGTKAMERIIEYADSKGLRVKLTPAIKDDFQGTTSKSRLTKFYKRFGFVENKGRNKDFEISESMYRDPQVLSQEVIETPEFKNWFGDSKVVDETGKPLVVYHGTAKEGYVETTDIKMFDKGKIGDRWSADQKGFFFTNNKSFATDYARSDRDYAVKGEGGGAIYPVFVSLKNPLIIDGSFLKKEGMAPIGIQEDTISFWDNYQGQIFEWLNEGNYDGVILKDSIHKIDGEPTKTVVAFESTQIKSQFNQGKFNPTDPKILAQNNRGTFQPETNIISLLENADLSTFLHESGHFFLEEMNNTPEFNQDMDVIFKWFGTTREEWNAQSLEEKRENHEKFARGFESYLFEGKAPSLELQGLFQRFRDWLVSVYKSLSKLNVKLTPEVRQVFDRMLATEEQIRQAEAARAYTPLFESIEDAGMTTKQWEAYQKLDSDRRTASRDELQSRSIQDMKWMSNAKARALKEVQKDVKGKRAEIRKQVEKDVSRETVYVATRFFRRGEIERDGEVVTTDNHRLDIKSIREMYEGGIGSRDKIVPELDSISVAVAKLGGLNKTEAEAHGIDPENWKGRNANSINQPVFGKRIFSDKGLSFDEMAENLSQFDYVEHNPNKLVDKLEKELSGDLQYSIQVDYNLIYSPYEYLDWNKLGHGKFGMLGKDGLDPEDASNLLGYPSADAMIRDIIEAPPKKEYIDAVTDQRMLETYGDISDPIKMERAAEEAIHNDAHTRFLHTELKSLTKGEGNRNVLARAAKDYANQAIGKKKVRDIKPQQYLSAQSRAGNNALKALGKGDHESAIDHKRAQVLNNHFYRSAIQGKKDVEKMLRYVKKFTKESTRKNIDPEYMEQIDNLMESFEYRNISLKQLDKRTRLADFIKQQEEMGFQPIIDEVLVDESKRKNYKNMALEELRGHVETIQQIDHLGRMKKKLLTAKDKREYAARIAEANLSLELNHNRIVPERATPSDKIESLGGWARQFGAIHRKVSSLVREMDGGRDNGVLYNLLLRPMNEAGDTEVEMKAEATKKLGALFEKINVRTGIGNVRAVKYQIPGTNISLTDENRIMFALNWGNKGNRQRLLDGGISGTRQMPLAEAQKVLDTLTQQEWDTVQGIWDFLETYRKQIGEQEKRLTGKTPNWVEPAEIETKYGIMRGGYFPAKYDTMLSTRSESLEAATNIRMGMKGAFNSAATRNGYTKERAKEVAGRPLLLNFNAISQHVGEVTHRLAWQDWLVDANRVIKSLDESIRKYYGPEILKEFQKMSEDIAVGDLPAAHAGETIFNHLRVGSTIVGMGWRITTAAIQPTGLAQSWVRIGVGPLGRGLKKFASNPVAAWKEAHEKSSMMRNRATTMQREVNEVLNTIRVGDKLGFAKQTAFWMIAKMQMTVDVPTWWGAYEKATMELNLEDARNQEERDIIDKSAIQMANQSVVDSQSGGMIKDLARVQRGNPYWKTVTNFYSYFSATYNLNIEAYRKQDFKSVGSAAEFMGDLIIINMIPAMMAVAIKGMLKGNCDGDIECIAEELKKEQLSYMFGQMIGLREIAGAAEAATGGQYYGYRGPAGLRPLADIGKLGQQAAQGEADAAFRRALLSVTGGLLHLPLGQVNATLDGITAVENGEVEGVGAVLAPLAGPPMARR